MRTIKNIYQVSAFDTFGGAARIAWSLHQSFKERNYNTWMAVGTKLSLDPGIYVIPNDTKKHLDQKIFGKLYDITKNIRFKIFGKNIYAFFYYLYNWRYELDVNLGREHFDYYGTRSILDLPPQQPDIIHLHNLHGAYFDLRYLPQLTYKIPTLITLHDSWLMSGLCAYSIECQKWITGCGHCPHLNGQPSAKKDATQYNWERKKRIYKQSKLYAAAPSKWLIENLKNSMLAENTYKTRVIPNGINLDIFHPDDKRKVRLELELNIDSKIMLFVAVGTYNNIFKDYNTIDQAVKIISQTMRSEKLLFIALGGTGSSKKSGNTEVRFIEHINDPFIIAKYYQAADIYLHAAHADTFPNVILEALACGLPVIATSVDGIPEQIEDGETGFLIPRSDAQAMAFRIEQLLNDKTLCLSMGAKAANYAKTHFGINRMVDDYLDYYQEIKDDWDLQLNNEI